MSLDVAKMLGLVQYPLLQPLTVRVANVEFLPVTHFVSTSGRLGQIVVRLLLRVIKIRIPLLGEDATSDRLEEEGFESGEERSGV